MKNRLGLWMAGCWAITGCASVFHSSQRTVRFTSEPSGATVCVRDARTGDIVQSGQTPVKLPLSSSAGYFSPASYRVEYSKTGHVRCASELQARVSLLYMGNLLFGCLPGLLVVDPLTGAMWRLDGSHHASLAPEPDVEPAADTDVSPQESSRRGE